MTTIRTKALAALREGRVAITEVTGDRVTASVASSRDGRPDHIVDWWGESGEWACTCQRFTREACGHVAAVQLVTGHASAAAREVTP